MNITSAAFRHGATMPHVHSAYGDNVSPPIRVEGLTPGTKSWVLIMEDPDAPRGPFTHWLVYNIDPRVHDIAEGTVPAGALEGTNDFGDSGYGGPRPASGQHRYFCTVYALARKLNLPPGASRAELETAMAHHILDSATMYGTFAASRPAAVATP